MGSLSLSTLEGPSTPFAERTCLSQLRKIVELNDMFANEAVDVLGVVDTVADSAMIQTRDGKDVSPNTPPFQHDGPVASCVD